MTTHTGRIQSLFPREGLRLEQFAARPFVSPGKL